MCVCDNQQEADSFKISANMPYSPRASHGFGYLISDRRFEYPKLLKMVIPCKKSWSAVLLLGELDSLPNYKSPNLLSVYLIKCMADFLCVMTL